MAPRWRAGGAIPCSRPTRARAARPRLVEELGGEALASNRELAEQADVVILAHKPYSSSRSPPRSAGPPRVVVSLLGARVAGRRPRRLPGRAGLPRRAEHSRRGAPAACSRFAEPDAEVDAGALRRAARAVRAARDGGRAARAAARPWPARARASAPPTGRCWPRRRSTPAIRRGLPARVATQLVIETMAGAAALLRATASTRSPLRRAVTSPGGTTARGLSGARARRRARGARTHGDGRRCSEAGMNAAVAAPTRASRSPTSSPR